MQESSRIYVERLRDGHSENIIESLPPDFLNVKEQELFFSIPVELEGEAYLAEDTLILHLHIKTEATMPCAICNENTQVLIDIPNFYWAQEVSEIKGGVFDFKELLRETILIEVPATVECHQGQCPERKELLKYFSKKSSKKEETFKPFADL